MKCLTQRSSNLTEIFQNLLRFSDISASEFNHCVFMENSVPLLIYLTLTFLVYITFDLYVHSILIT